MIVPRWMLFLFAGALVSGVIGAALHVSSGDCFWVLLPVWVAWLINEETRP